MLTDLKGLFGSLDGLSICEIGVGYGGQCNVIDAFYSPKTYQLVDIKSALLLAQTYLDHFILKAVLTYKTMNELETRSYDLVISNYAFTELPRAVQDVYLQKVILNSAKGYITYNENRPAYFNSYTRTELLGLIPGSKIIAETPLTEPKNCLIVWG